MLELIIVLVIYTVVILLFVPLDEISKWQVKVKNWFKKIGS